MFKKLLPIYLIQFVNTAGFGLLMPVMPFVIDKYQGGNEIFYGVFLSLYSLFQFLSSPVIGKLSDIYGRKSMLFLSQGGTLLSWMLFASAWYADSGVILGFAIPLWIMTIAHSLDGLTAGNSAIIPAYISDIVKPQNRSKAFATNGAMAGLGMMLGPLIGGLTASSKYGFLATSVFAIALSLVTLVMIFRLKETNKDSSSTRFRWKDIYKNLNIIKGFKKYSNHKILPTLFFSKLFFFLAFAAYTSTAFLFIKDEFLFNSAQLGQFMVSVGIFLILNQALIGKKIIVKIGDYSSLMLGFVFSSVALLLVYFSAGLSVYLMIVASYFMTLGISLTFPTLSALSIKYATEKSKGEISGLMDSIGSFGNAIVPLYATALYMYMGEYSFLVSIAMLIVGLAVLARIRHLKV